ncbi:MFS_1 like family protein [Terribacillus saccharophilus]|uniref:MFS_1 like family protein n=1 Tax=Terribacillus saccharophilus TaxID=361277 RepID=A0AAX2ED78_9BACI|nr:MFS_1 like family protein [Terribacillus saccharophilus]
MIYKFKDSYLSYVLLFNFYFFALGLFSSIMSIYLSGMEKSPAEISFIVSSVGIFSIVIQPIVGYFADKTNSPKFISTITLILAGVSGVAFIFFQSNILLFILNGLTLSFVNSVSPINEKLATNSRFRYGNIRIWGAIGFALASQIAAVTYEFISPTFNFILFFIAIILSIIGYYGTTEVEVQKKTSSNRVSFKEVSYGLGKNTPYILFLFITLLFTGMTTVNNTYLPLLILGNGSQVSFVGTVMFLATLVEVPLILFSHFILDRLSSKKLLIISFLIIIVQFGIYGIFSSVSVIMVSAFLFKALATMLFIMITLKVVIGIVNPKYVNSALGFAATLKAIGGLVFQVLSGSIVDMFNVQTLYQVFVVLSVIGLVLIFIMKMPENRKQSLFSGQGNKE